ncbi:hypothetical protein, partial [Chelativorans sp. YIM 93263]|uniref:hypothetical protein n=1 Tax=Chelativorans sp. YIM 93263 TaxID=2906648 RepID=UPI002379DEF9
MLLIAGVSPTLRRGSREVLYASIHAQEGLFFVRFAANRPASEIDNTPPGKFRWPRISLSARSRM